MTGYLPLPAPAPAPPAPPPPVESPVPPVGDAPLDVPMSPPPLIVPEVLPLDIEPLVLVVAGPLLFVLLAAPPVPLDMLLGPDPFVPWVAGAVVEDVWASATPEHPIERAVARPISLRVMRIS
jgi:hypothetical protein